MDLQLLASEKLNWIVPNNALVGTVEYILR